MRPTPSTLCGKAVLFESMHHKKKKKNLAVSIAKKGRKKGVPVEREAITSPLTDALQKGRKDKRTSTYSLCGK